MGNKNSTPKPPTNGHISSSCSSISADKKSKRYKSFTSSTKKFDTSYPLANANGNSNHKNGTKNSENSKNDKNSNGNSQPAYYSDTIFRSPINKPDNPSEKQLSKVIMPEQELDLKIYKRSRDGLDTIDNRSHRSRSLPRCKSAALRKSTDTLLSSSNRNGARQQRYSSFAANNNNYNVSYNSRWSSIVGSECPDDVSRPVGLQGVLFPAEHVILLNKNTFEQSYVDCLINQYYKSLPQMVQLSAIIIGYRRIFTKSDVVGDEPVVNVSYEPINLWQYFNCTQDNWVPEDLVAPQASEWFISAVPVNLLTGLVHLRREGGNESNLNEQMNLCIEIVKCVSFEATKEISRMYEYQISVVPDQGSVQQLGKHAAERSVEYLRSGNRFVERDSLIEGVAYLPPDALNEELGGFVSSIFGTERELQWDIRRVFCCCGLRVYNYVDAVTSTVAENNFFSPVNFLTSRDCMPLVYGYRNVLQKRNIETGTDVTSLTDVNRFPDRLDENLDDFHRDYIPLSEMKRMKTAMTSAAASINDNNMSDILRRNKNLNVNNYKFYNNPTQNHLTTSQHAYNNNNNNNNNIYNNNNYNVIDNNNYKIVGRNSKPSTSTLIPGSVNGFRHSMSNSNSNRSSVLTNPNYSSLARSTDLGSGQDDRTSMGSPQFNRDVPSYKSARSSAIGGGHLSKYVNGHPNRISVNNGNNDTNRNINQNTVKRGIIKNQNQQVNHNQSYNYARPIETSFEYEGNADWPVTNQNAVVFNRCQSSVENYGRVNNNVNGSAITGQSIQNGATHNLNGGVRAKLPPKPPIRTISSPNYNYSNLNGQQQQQSLLASNVQQQHQQQLLEEQLKQQLHQRNSMLVQQPQQLQQSQQQRQCLSSYQALPDLPPELAAIQQQSIMQQLTSATDQHKQQPLQQNVYNNNNNINNDNNINNNNVDSTNVNNNNINNKENDFLDFSSFLRLVEQQNANLQSFEQKIMQNNQQQLIKHGAISNV